MKIFAIDPGTTESAFVVWENNMVWNKGKYSNEKIIDLIIPELRLQCDVFAFEMVASYGMPVGKDIFETVFWTGRFYQSFVNPFCKGVKIYRKDVKMHLCNHPRAKDSNIRQALIDRFGKPGTKKNPGLLYGVTKDIWAALAIAVYTNDTYTINEDNGKRKLYPELP